MAGQPTLIQKLIDHISGTADKHAAIDINVTDTPDNYTGTNVESILAEIAASIDGLVIPVLWKTSSNFAGSTGKILTHDLGTAAYKVIITPTQSPDGYLGEVWVTKSTNTCTVYCSGTATTTFDLVIIKN